MALNIGARDCCTVLRSVMLVTWPLFQTSARILTLMIAVSFWMLLKYLVSPVSIFAHAWRWRASRLEVVALLVYLAANGLGIAYVVMTVRQISSRYDWLSTMNAMPLSAGHRLSFVADSLGLSLWSQAAVYNWMGLLATGRALAHTSCSLQAYHWKIFHLCGIAVRPMKLCARPRTNGLCVQTSIGLAIAFVPVVPLFRRTILKMYLHAHAALSLAARSILWRHLSPRKLYIRLYVLVGLLLWAFLTVTQILLYLFRNLSFRKTVGHTIVTHLDDALRLDVSVTRPWKVRAGDYVYLWIPGVSFWSFVQSDPLTVTWWEHNDADTLTLSFLVQPRRGMTRDLRRQTHSSLLTFVDGPHGRPVNFGEFGTVLMFASGIGIGAQLPHIKALITGYRNHEICTRRIMLVWQIEKECLSLPNHLVHLSS